MTGMLLWAAPEALADSTTSVNWAGYAAHRSGVHFRSVSADWRVPAPDCSAAPGYSSIWVGLGGYSRNSDALEQTGVEADCSAGGQPSYFAWYELVPSPPHQIPIVVRAGDLMRGSVSAAGRKVTILLKDLSARRSFSRTFSPGQLDVTAADWILEAPSQCNPSAHCLTLPLDDFGRAGFTAVHAATLRGGGGSVTSRWWNTTKITLVPHGARFLSDTADGGPQAIPSPPAAGGSAFTVSYQAASQNTGSAGSGAQVPAAPGARIARVAGSQPVSGGWLATARLIRASP